MATNIPRLISASQKQVSEREATKTLHKIIDLKNAIGNPRIYKNGLDINQNLGQGGKAKVLIQQTDSRKCQKESHRVRILQRNQQFQGKPQGIHEHKRRCRSQRSFNGVQYSCQRKSDG